MYLKKKINFRNLPFEEYMLVYNVINVNNINTTNDQLSTSSQTQIDSSVDSNGNNKTSTSELSNSTNVTSPSEHSDSTNITSPTPSELSNGNNVTSPAEHNVKSQAEHSNGNNVTSPSEHSNGKRSIVNDNNSEDVSAVIDLDLPLIHQNVPITNVTILMKRKPKHQKRNRMDICFLFFVF